MSVKMQKQRDFRQPRASTETVVDFEQNRASAGRSSQEHPDAPFASTEQGCRFRTKSGESSTQERNSGTGVSGHAGNTENVVRAELLFSEAAPSMKEIRLSERVEHCRVIWVAVKIMVPFWTPVRVPQKGP